MEAGSTRLLKAHHGSGVRRRVGHPFADAYKSELDPAVYDSLLDLANTTKQKIADLRPRDMIDVQSFMWTAVEYTEEDKPA